MICLYVTRRISIVQNSVIIREWSRTGLWLQQTEHVHGHGYQNHDDVMGVKIMMASWVSKSWWRHGYQNHDGVMGIKIMMASWVSNSWWRHGYQTHDGVMGIRIMMASWVSKSWCRHGYQNHNGVMGIKIMMASWISKSWWRHGYQNHDGSRKPFKRNDFNLTGRSGCRLVCVWWINHTIHP